MSSSPLAAEPSDVYYHLSLLFGACEAGSGLIEINWDRRDPRDDQWKLNQWRRFPVADIQAAVDCVVSATNDGARVYVGAGLRRPDLQQNERSTNSDIVAWPALVWDFDDKEAADAGLAKAKEIGLGFNLVVQTGAIRRGGEEDLRVQCWCVLDKPETDLDRVRVALQSGIRTLGSDKSIHDARRVMRVGGSVAFARKDGRVDEMTRVRDDLETKVGACSLTSLSPLLVQAPPMPQRVVDPARVAEIQARLEESGGVHALWDGSSSAAQFIVDLAEGVEMNPSLFNLAKSAAGRGWAADVIEAALRIILDTSAAQTTRPDRVEQLYSQLPSLCARAIRDAGVLNPTPPRSAAEDFEDPDEPEHEADEDATALMFQRSIWVEAQEIIFDRVDRTPRKTKQFDAHWAQVGAPTSNRHCASTRFLGELPTNGPLRQGNRVTVKNYSYLPGAGLIIETDKGPMLNTWVGSKRIPNMAATAEDAKPWLDHIQFVCGGNAEHFLNYFAYMLQFPAQKINHAIMIKSRAQGVGKGVMLRPITEALGYDNSIEIGPSDIGRDFNSWAEGKKLVIVEEMHVFDKKDTMQRLKGYITAPPMALRINKKGQQEFMVPNILSMVFFSNMSAPVALEEGDRRFWVVDADVAPKDREYYDSLSDWYDAGGYETIFGYLLTRDVTGFNAKGNAPETQAKLDMIEDARPVLDAWVADSIFDRIAPFDREYVVIDEIKAFAPRGKYGEASSTQLGTALRAAGAKPATDKMRLKLLGATRAIWCLRPNSVKDKGAELTRAAWEKEHTASKAVSGRYAG